jgi:hypothetical protein
MLPYVSMILFAVYAAIKLGQKVRVIYEDKVRDQDLILPPVGVVSPTFPDWDLDVRPFFENEGQAFVAPPPKKVKKQEEETKPQPPKGLYFDWWQDRGLPANQIKLTEAYQRITGNVSDLSAADDVKGEYRREPDKFYQGANALFVVQQWREGTDPKRPVWQRLAGTVVELAVDYVKVDPGLFGGKGKGDRITRAFLLSLDEVKFAESRHDDLLLEILQASLNTFAGQVDLVVGDDTLALLLKRVSATLADRVEEAGNDAHKLLTLDTFRREVLQDILKVSAATTAEHAQRLLGSSDSDEEQLLNAVLQAVLQTFQEQSQVLSTQTLRAIYGAGLEAAAQNAALLLPELDGRPSHEFLSQLFTGTVKLLAEAGQAGPQALLTPDLARDVIALALDTLSQNARQLVDPQNPQEQLLVQALERIIIAFSEEFHEDPDLPRVLAETFSQRQVAAIIREVFAAVAKNPEGLLPGRDDDPRRSALAQILGSVAAVVSRDSRRLLTPEGYIELLQVALEAFALNPDRLINLDTADPLDNVMAKVMTAVLMAATDNLEEGGRHLLWGEVLLQAMEAALGAVSKNTEGFLAEPAIVILVLKRLLVAASGGQANVLDAENLLLVFSPLLIRALEEGRGILDEEDEELILRYLTYVS